MQTMAAATEISTDRSTVGTFVFQEEQKKVSPFSPPPGLGRVQVKSSALLLSREGNLRVSRQWFEV